MNCRVACIAIGFALVSTLVAAQDWVIREFRGSVEEVREEVTGLVEDGYAPVGVDVSETDGFLFLLVDHAGFPSSAWSLLEFSDLSTVNQEMSAVIGRGWTPVDISFAGGSLFALFTDTDTSIAGWQIAETSFATMQISTVVEDFREQDYGAWGISQRGDRLAHLFLSERDEEAFATTIVGFDPDAETLRQGITTLVNEGWIPWGIARRGEELLTLFRVP
jgi:hypothetical protein